MKNKVKIADCQKKHTIRSDKELTLAQVLDKMLALAYCSDKLSFVPWQ